MTFSRYCPGETFCEKTEMNVGTSTTLTNSDGWENLLNAEVRMVLAHEHQ